MGPHIVASAAAGPILASHRNLPIYDITRSLSAQSPAYPGDPPFEITRHAALSNADPFDLTSISLSSHLGTHVDAPSHFVPSGATVDELSLEVLTGQVTLRHLDGHGGVSAEELARAAISQVTNRLLLGLVSAPDASGSQRYLSEAGARWVADRGITLLGTDVLSIDPVPCVDFPAHRILLSAGILVVESLDLSAAPQGDYTMYCLPLKVVGTEAAPARVILVC